VSDELEKQLEQLPRKEIAKKALNNSKAIVLNTIDEVIELVNEYASSI
jgi:histidinol dehydrogenase